jgi:hypothetical protein
MLTLMHLPILWMMTHLDIQVHSTSLRESIYLCVSTTTLTLSSLTSTWHLVNSKLTLDELKARKTDSDPLEVSKKKPDYKQYRVLSACRY